MGPKVLALIENSIGVRLTLASRLTHLGCKVTILTPPETFGERIEREAFDWIFIDDAAVPPYRRHFFEHLADHRHGARVVWCGKRPRERVVRIEAVFDKPLRYDEIERFFSHWMADVGRARQAREAIPWKPVGKAKGSADRLAGKTQKIAADGGGVVGTTGTEEEKQQ